MGEATKKKPKADNSIMEAKTYRNKVRRLAKHVREHPKDSPAVPALEALRKAGVHKPRRAPRFPVWTASTIRMSKWAAGCGYDGRCVLRWHLMDNSGKRLHSVYDGYKYKPGLVPSLKKKKDEKAAKL